MFDVKTLIRPNIATLEPYRCARDDFKTGVLLDANENTHGPALKEISNEENALELNRYPDPHQIELKQQVIGNRNGKPNEFLQNFDQNKLKPENICLGVGSDESIDLLLRCVCTPGKDKLLICPPTYGMYSICATINDISLTEVPLKYPSFQVDVDAILDKVTADSSIKLVYLTSPGNPTGQLLNCSDIIQLLEGAASKWNGLIVVDEAYIDFADTTEVTSSPSVSTLVNQYPNLVVMQTLSKAFGLAGIRLGITFANAELSKYLNAMRYPYNISSLTSNVALRATSAESGLKTMAKYVASINSQRDLLVKRLEEVDGIGRNIGGLDSNFILVEILDKDKKPSNEVAKALYNKLAVSNGVVVRFRGNELNCTGALRISIGTADENDFLVQKIQKCLQEIYNESA